MGGLNQSPHILERVACHDEKVKLGRFIPAVVTVALIFVFAIVIRAYAAQLFEVPSGSMSPTLQAGDRIVVNKIVGPIHLGDIVVFRRVAADGDHQYADLVKRVIGLPGQTISSVGDTVLINGKVIKEPWLPKLGGLCAESTFDIRAQRIPAGRYFVMGDCRGDSSDSRSWGTVPAHNIIGKVVAIIWRHDHPWMHWF
jgi:signal peptidase I